MNDYSCDSGVKRIDLQRTRFTTTVCVNNFELKHIKGLDEIVRNKTCYELDCYIASKVVENYAFNAPMDWWEAVKERFAPKWFLTRYPIRYRVEKIDAVALYPSIPLKNSEPYLVIYESNNE